MRPSTAERRAISSAPLHINSNSSSHGHDYGTSTSATTATPTSTGWWIIIPTLCIFQLFLLYRWSLVSSMVLADHRLLYRKARDVTKIQQAVEGKGVALGLGGDAFMRSVVGNVSARLEAREAELVNLGYKLLEREKELTGLQDQLTKYIDKAAEAAKGGSGAGANADAARLAAGFPPVPKECGRQKDVGRKGKVKWRPAQGRYLLVMCNGGQLSNRISCMRQHMLDAALLNRTLVLPSHGIDYDYDNLLDMEAPRTCFGKDSFLTLNEFAERVKPTKIKGRVKPAVMFVDKFVCHVHLYQKEGVCGALIPAYEDLGIRFSRPVVPELRTPSPWYKYKSADFVREFAFPDALVLAFGNMFGVGGADLRFRGSAPLAVSEKCKYYIMPSKPIMSVAGGFINTFLGSKYISLHLRRGDFYDHCVIKGNSAKPCYHPLHQVASCIERRLAQNPGFHMVYLSTNGDEMEVQTLRELLQAKAGALGGVSLVRLPVLQAQAWAEPLIKRGLHKEPEVVSLVEKTINVMAPRFYGTGGSTYSGDISRLRDWLMTSSCQDANICPDDEPADTRKSFT